MEQDYEPNIYFIKQDLQSTILHQIVQQPGNVTIALSFILYFKLVTISLSILGLASQGLSECTITYSGVWDISQWLGSQVSFWEQQVSTIETNT